MTGQPSSSRQFSFINVLGTHVEGIWPNHNSQPITPRADQLQLDSDFQPSMRLTDTKANSTPHFSLPTLSHTQDESDQVQLETLERFRKVYE